MALCKMLHNRKFPNQIRFFCSKKPDDVIKVQLTDDGITKIIMNRPAKLNAFTDEMFIKFTAAMSESNRNPQSKITVITGAGSAFTAGADRSRISVGDITVAHTDSIVRPFMESFILYDKPLIGLLNGVCVGLMATLLAFYDVILASDKAKIFIPFGRLGLVAEGCSTITFPRLMGSLKASEVLLFDKKLTAQEALDRNLVNEVIPHEKFEEEIAKRLQIYAKFNPEAMRESKRLLRLTTVQEMLDCNRREIQINIKMRQSETTKNAITQLLMAGRKEER